MTDSARTAVPLADGTVYSSRKGFRPFSTPSPESYALLLGEKAVDRLRRAADRLKGLKLLELNATAMGGGVAEMLYSAVPMLDRLGIESEWKVIQGNADYFECTKNLHNLLQGREGCFTREMQETYFCTLESCAACDFIDYTPDIVVAHDPQPLGLTRYLKKPGETWMWRCHIDMEEAVFKANPGLWDFVTEWVEHYDAAMFSAAHYIVSCWPLPKFIVPPFIDPLSEKNRELTQEEIDRVLAKYQIDAGVPIVAQIGRFDPWKGLDRTISTFREVRKERRCQLILAGGLASDDPEGERVVSQILEETKDDGDIRVLNLPLADRLENWKEVNALQRAATVIMQPSTREGFGLVITEALWKGKPVIAANVGAIPLQIVDGETGLFYRTPATTAKQVVHLLDNPEAAAKMGERGRSYVKNHFLLPDRLADCLMAADMTLRHAVDKETCADCITSFHPWFKLSKRS